MPQSTPSVFLSFDSTAALTPPVPAISAGRGDALQAARQRFLDAAKALQALEAQAPRLKDTLQDQLKRHFQIDPYACGLKHDTGQVTLLTLAARVLASPTFATPFANWQPWGFPEDSPYATWTADDWQSGLVPVWAGTGISAWTGYWSGRMPGKAVSRKTHAAQLLREHFAASLDLAFGLDHIEAAAWLQGQPEPSPEYALVRWVQPDGKTETCTTALLIKPRAEETRWLLYRPDADTTIHTFADHAKLRTWLHANRYMLWPDPATPLVAGSSDSAIDWISTMGDGFDAWVDEILAHKQRTTSNHLTEAAQESKTDPLDWTMLQAWEEKRALDPRPALPRTLEQKIDSLIAYDQQMAANELHFDALPRRLPLGWRKQRVARQEQLLAAYLGDDTAPSSHKMATLRQHQAELEAVATELEQLFSQLPASITSTTWGEQHAEASRFDHLSQLLARALKGEARFQHLLGELQDEHLSWVEQLVERPEPSLQRMVQPYAVHIKVGSNSWQLTGLLALQGVPDSDTLDPDRSWLLFLAGRDGGLMHLESQAQLAERVQATLYGAWPESLAHGAWPQGPQALLDALYDHPQSFELVCQPITTHAFDYCIQTIQASLPQNPSLETVETRLGLGINQARSKAFDHQAERNRTDLISTQLISQRSPDSALRAELAAEVQALRGAMLASSQLLERDLPERGQFARSALEQQLRTDFQAKTVPVIKLDIADSISHQRIPAGESGIGHAVKQIVTFSTSRSAIELPNFLLWALDDDLNLRLSNARILFSDGPVEPKVRAGVTLSYIANLVEKLDLPNAYEKRITDAFKGLPDETVFESEQRQEALRAPFVHQLKIIALSRPDALDEAGQRMLELFCQEQARTDQAHTIDFHSVLLRPGRAVDGRSTAVTLSGVFLLQAATGPTLLLMPDAPDGKTISQHATPALACQALERMALAESMRSYLAKLPLDDAQAEHLAYINTALSKGFSGFIAPGIALPGLLATHQANLVMGRLIHENRATSRSQVDLYLESEAIRHGRVYDYIKMALGFVPLVGSAVALYDGWHAANDSVEAFLRGDSASGIEHLNSVFLSLFDALMDLTPSAALPTKTGRLARVRTQQRQLASTSLKTNHYKYSTSFSGYETEVPTGRWTAHPNANGVGVHRHVKSKTDYIVRNGRYYQVEWDETDLTWRLKATATRTYKQPVRLSDTGVWETHGSLSGHLVNSGLAGGGAYISAFYDRSLATLRGVLGLQPRQVTPLDILREIHADRQNHRAQLSATTDALNQARGIGPHGPVGQPASAAVINNARDGLVARLRNYMDFHEQALERLRSMRADIGRANAGNIIYEIAFDMGRQHPKLIEQLHLSLSARFRQVTPFNDVALDALTPPAQIHAHVIGMQRTYSELATTLGDIEQELRRCAKLRNQLQGDNLTRYIHDLEALDIPLHPDGYRAVRLSVLGVTLMAPDAVFDIVFLRQFNDELTALRSALYSHGDLWLTNLSRRQEHRLLNQFQERYRRFDTRMRIWKDNYPEHVRADAISKMRTELSLLISETEQALAATAPRPAAPPPRRGTSRPRLFETEDQQLYIGREATVDGQRQMQIANVATNQAHAAFSKTPQGTWRSNQAAHLGYNATLQQLETAALRRLAKAPEAEASLQRYKTLNMLPQDLEDYAKGCASPLRELATSITNQAGGDITDALRDVVRRLKQAATQLDALGRRLRIEQTKATQNPTASHLEYLNAEGEVTLQWSRVLDPAKNKQGQPIEYLEEYKIIDTTTGEAFWYAHFHFKKRPRQQFGGLEAGHLKLASERNQKAGAWRGPLTEAQANTLFDGLRPNQA
ncbi:hypothetical protein [Pseudomonas guariconensis]|uniref:hypothetical protein n=1 Tax=Pseudomonas guariconensis TaxID=1288410 RepID=UPI0018A9ECBA|nr:hypothetical protein [Pseudomonas guariconensis]MBF8755316.1 hypothetical protein [Pseudomonas guariconensis]